MSPPAQEANNLLAELPVDDLIDLYFEAEEPSERDLVFAQLCTHEGPQVDGFLSALLAHDDDVFLRLTAASQLVGRGYAPARQVLLDTLFAAGDDEVFEEAVDALVRACGAEAFDELAPLAADAERDLSERLAAMVGMERADGPRAAAAFLADVAKLPGAEPLDAALLEGMLGCFVREQTAEALPALQALLARLPTSEDEASLEARREVQGALAVLTEDLAGEPS